MNQHTRPIPDSYWVTPGRFLAGEYPGSKDDQEAQDKIRRLLDAGVTFFLDLTEAGEYNLKPYTPFLPEETTPPGRSIVHHRMPIPDGGTPSMEEMHHILDTIDRALHQGHTVYVHCWGGIGQTGTVVGCYMVGQGMTGRQAVDEIARRRRGTPDGHRPSPENDQQEQMILSWLPNLS